MFFLTLVRKFCIYALLTRRDFLRRLPPCFCSIQICTDEFGWNLYHIIFSIIVVSVVKVLNSLKILKIIVILIVLSEISPSKTAPNWMKILCKHDVIIVFGASGKTSRTWMNWAVFYERCGLPSSPIMDKSCS